MTKIDISALIERARYDGPTVSADQLVGVEACLGQLQGQIALTERPELGERFGLLPSGTLFIGKPGTGKTLLARYLAGHLGIPLYHFSADEFGDDPGNIHRIFRDLGNQRVLIFIDEVSLLAQKRERMGSAEEKRMLSALLTSIDGLHAGERTDRPWVIGACTPDIRLDPAIHRSGRLGVIIEFALPSEEQRRQLFDLYLKRVPHGLKSDDLDRVAEMSEGATGADIADYVSQAAAQALAEHQGGDPLIEPRQMEKVVARRGYISAERPGREPTWATCVHEAAHAVLAYRLFGRAALAKVTVGFARTRGARLRFGGGHFELSQDWLESNPPNSRTLRDHAAVGLAGACAEELILGYRTAGVATDVASATNIVLDEMEHADPLFGPSRTEIEGSGPRDSNAGSQAMRQTAWAIARARFDEVRLLTEALVGLHRLEIERLARALLLGKQTLTGDEIVDAIEGGLAGGAGGAVVTAGERA